MIFEFFQLQNRDQLRLVLSTCLLWVLYEKLDTADDRQPCFVFNGIGPTTAPTTGDNHRQSLSTTRVNH